MTCNCRNTIVIQQSEDIKEMESNILVQLAVDGYRWKTLYRCKFCNTFWEESYIDGRWGGEPQLSKISNDYVSEEWGEKFL